MSLFLLSFILIYGSVHAYAFCKARGALGFSNAMAAIIIVFFVVMIISPVLVRVAEKNGLELLASVLAHISYIWMGLLFLFFSASLAIDLYNFLIVCGGKLLHKDVDSSAPAAAPSFYVPLVLAIVITVYGYFEAGHIRTERLVIATPKLPPSAKKLVLVQISDLHLGLMVGKARLGQVVQKIRAENPDLVVSTGDLVDGQLDGLAALVPLLQELKPRLGKYAVTGNHEFYAGFSQAISFTEQAGFTLLRQTSVNIGDWITLAGVDDPASHRGAQKTKLPEKGLLAGGTKEKFTVLLKHRPVIEPESLGLFDLQLSGHVHKGQIFPFNLLTHLFYPVKMGFSTYSGNSSLYVSRGTGTWGPPIRFLAPPEITVIEIVPASLR